MFSKSRFTVGQAHLWRALMYQTCHLSFSLNIFFLSLCSYTAVHMSNTVWFCLVHYKLCHKHLVQFSSGFVAWLGKNCKNPWFFSPFVILKTWVIIFLETLWTKNCCKLMDTELNSWPAVPGHCSLLCQSFKALAFVLASLSVKWKYDLLEFEGRSCVTPALCMEQGVQRPSVKGVFFTLADLLKDPEASKAGCFLLAFLACWPRQDQCHSLSQKVPHGLTAHAAPELSHPSFFLSLFECGTRRDSTSCQDPQQLPLELSEKGSLSDRVIPTFPSCLCASGHTYNLLLSQTSVLNWDMGHDFCETAVWVPASLNQRTLFKKWAGLLLIQTNICGAKDEVFYLSQPR